MKVLHLAIPLWVALRSYVPLTYGVSQPQRSVKAVYSLSARQLPFRTSSLSPKTPTPRPASRVLPEPSPHEPKPKRFEPRNVDVSRETSVELWWLEEPPQLLPPMGLPSPPSFVGGESIEPDPIVTISLEKGSFTRFIGREMQLISRSGELIQGLSMQSIACPGINTCVVVGTPVGVAKKSRKSEPRELKLQFPEEMSIIRRLSFSDSITNTNSRPAVVWILSPRK